MMLLVVDGCCFRGGDVVGGRWLLVVDVVD